MTAPIVLYGMPGSLYTAKVRCYLRHRRLEFIERPPGDPRFGEEVLPAIQRWIIPVVTLPDGELVQDGTVIIDRLEGLHPPAHPVLPDDPVLRVIAHLFELFGSEGMLRPAMHYRWNFDEANLAFLREDFMRALAPHARGEEKDELFRFASGRMREAARAMGVTPETIPTIEASHTAFLALFQAHLAKRPFLLGGHPTAGDYALSGPLYAHMGRDPYPTDLMKRTALGVWRWCERMNAANSDQGEYGDLPTDLLAPDAIPETLKALMRFVAVDYLPDILGQVRFANEWLAQRPELRPGETGLDKPSRRAIGVTSVNWRGHDITVPVMPYRFFLLQRLQDAYDATPANARRSIDLLFDETGLTALLRERTARRVERAGHLEVWGEALNTV